MSRFSTQQSLHPNQVLAPVVHHSTQIAQTASEPADFVALHLETRTHVNTAVMCRHINRQCQTARGWASAETYPPELKPIRIFGRLHWPVAGIRTVLGVAK